MSDDRVAVQQRLKDDFPHYADRCLKIRPKKGGLIPFGLNFVQRYIHKRLEEQLAETGWVRVLILKARQPGCSTLIQGRYYWKVAHRRGVQAFILTHKQDATDNLFTMTERLGLSPDSGDAAALTFAAPVHIERPPDRDTRDRYARALDRQRSSGRGSWMTA